MSKEITVVVIEFATLFENCLHGGKSNDEITCGASKCSVETCPILARGRTAKYRYDAGYDAGYEAAYDYLEDWMG